MKPLNQTLSVGALVALLCSHAAAATGDDMKISLFQPAAADVKTVAIAPKKDVIEATAPAAHIDAARPKPQREVRGEPSQWRGDEIVHVPDADGISAAARGWKAHFGTDGTRFVPYFGAQAARSEPLTFDVLGIQAGGQALDVRALSVNRVTERVRIERGLVDEAYELTSSAIEQLFIVDARVDGDLRVRVGFSGNYGATQTEDGIRFENELGTVHYGTARAFDARGDSVAVTEHLEDGSIELVVPAAWLATASYPVTIDPVIATYTAMVVTEVLLSPDIAFEGGTGIQALAFEYAFSATDHDVYVRKSNDGVLLDLLPIDTSTENWAAPSIASNKSSAQFLVACEVGAAGSRRVKTRTVDASTSAVGPVLALSNAFSGEQIAPVVGGDPSDIAPTYFLVAYMRTMGANDQDVLGQLVSATGSPLGAILILDNTSATFDSDLAISKCDGTGDFSTQHWALAWQRTFSATDHDVYAMEVNWDGSIRNPAWGVLTSTLDERAPSVSSPTNVLNGERSCVVAIQREAAASQYDTTVVAVKNGANVDTLDLDVALGTPYDTYAPVIECDGRQFMTASSVWWGFTDFDVMLVGVSLVEGELSLNQTTPAFLANTGFSETMLTVAAKHSGGLDSTQYCFGWRALAANSTYAVRGAVYEGPHGGLSKTFCGGPASSCPCGTSGTGVSGCPNSFSQSGASLNGSGSASASYDSFYLLANNMPPGTMALFFQGTIAGVNGVGLWYGDGLYCVGGSIVRLGVKSAPAGQAYYPIAGDVTISVRGQIPNVGGMRAYQAWYRDALPYCTSSTFNLTNGVETLWVP